MKPADHAAFILMIFASATVLGTEPERTVSFSRQFIIYGLDTRSRGAICEMAEQIKSDVIGLLRRPDGWTTPIIINLQLPQANLPEVPPSALRFSQTGAGLKLQVDLVIGDRIDRAVIQRQLMRAVLLEMIYRKEANVREGTAYVDPPPWLIDGFLALEPGNDRTRMIEALAVSGRPISLPDFVQLRPATLDSVTRDVYRAYSFAFVQLLFDMSEGDTRLGRYIDSLSRASNDPLADLATFFPSLNRKNVATIWDSHIQQLIAGSNYQLLTFAETEARLAIILKIPTGHQSAETELDEFFAKKLSPDQRDQLTQLSADLLILAPRSNPVLRPIVEQYQQIAGQLASGKRRHIANRLAALNLTRTKLVERMDRIDDYMNWFEATQMQTSSGLFDNYSDASLRKPRKSDALSMYLDALEAEF